jgi:hypothetical protein
VKTAWKNWATHTHTHTHTHMHTHTHTHTCWCHLWGIRVVEVTYHCLPWSSLWSLWGTLVKFPDTGLRVDPVSLYIVYASTLGCLVAWTSTQWEIARECSFIYREYRVSREMIWLLLVWNVASGHQGSTFYGPSSKKWGHLWWYLQLKLFLRQALPKV